MQVTSLTPVTFLFYPFIRGRLAAARVRFVSAFVLGKTNRTSSSLHLETQVMRWADSDASYK